MIPSIQPTTGGTSSVSATRQTVSEMKVLLERCFSPENLALGRGSRQFLFYNKGQDCIELRPLRFTERWSLGGISQEQRIVQVMRVAREKGVEVSPAVQQKINARLAKYEANRITVNTPARVAIAILNQVEAARLQQETSPSPSHLPLDPNCREQYLRFCKEALQSRSYESAAAFYRRLMQGDTVPIELTNTQIPEIYSRLHVHEECKQFLKVNKRNLQQILNTLKDSTSIDQEAFRRTVRTYCEEIRPNQADQDTVSLIERTIPHQVEWQGRNLGDIFTKYGL